LLLFSEQIARRRYIYINVSTFYSHYKLTIDVSKHKITHANTPLYIHSAGDGELDARQNTNAVDYFKLPARSPPPLIDLSWHLTRKNAPRNFHHFICQPESILITGDTQINNL